MLLSQVCVFNFQNIAVAWERALFIHVCGDDTIPYSIFTLNWRGVNILSRSSAITMNMDEEVSLIAKDTTAALRAGHKKKSSIAELRR